MVGVAAGGNGFYLQQHHNHQEGTQWSIFDQNNNEVAAFKTAGTNQFCPTGYDDSDGDLVLHQWYVHQACIANTANNGCNMTAFPLNVDGDKSYIVPGPWPLDVTCVTESTEDEQSTEDDEALSVGAIAGISVGALVVIGGGAFAWYNRQPTIEGGSFLEHFTRVP